MILTKEEFSKLLSEMGEIIYNFIEADKDGNYLYNTKPIPIPWNSDTMLLLRDYIYYVMYDKKDYLFTINQYNIKDETTKLVYKNNINLSDFRKTTSTSMWFIDKSSLSSPPLPFQPQILYRFNLSNPDNVVMDKVKLYNVKNIIINNKDLALIIYNINEAALLGDDIIYKYKAGDSLELVDKYLVIYNLDQYTMDIIDTTTRKEKSFNGIRINIQKIMDIYILAIYLSPKIINIESLMKDDSSFIRGDENIVFSANVVYIDSDRHDVYLYYPEDNGVYLLNEKGLTLITRRENFVLKMSIG